jgi:hypothetical protein
MFHAIAPNSLGQEANMFNQLTVYVSIKKSGASNQEIVRLAHNLISDLQEIDGVRVFGDAGDKLGTSDFYAILAKLASASAIDSFVKVIGSWLTRDRTCTLKLQIGTNSIEATGLTREEQRELIRWFRVQAGLRFDR